MNVLALTAFILVELFFLSFIVLIVRGGLKNKVNRSFFYFLLAFALWVASNFVSNITSLPHDTMLLLNRVLFAVSVIGLYSLLDFITLVTHQVRGRISTTVSIAVATLGIAVGISPYTVSDVYVDSSASVGVQFGSMASVYFLAVVYISGYILYRLARGVRQSSAKERSKAQVLLVSIGVAIATILATNVLIPFAFSNFGFTSVGLFAGLFIIAGVSYGIVRHGMFDIKRAAARSVAYSLVLISLAVGYFILAFLASLVFGSFFEGGGQAISGVVISLVLALVFQPIRYFFDRFTNKVFYKNEYINDEFFAALNQTLVSTTDLRQLLKRVSDLIALTLKSEHASFFVHTRAGHHVSVGTSEYVRLPVADAKELEAYFGQSPAIIRASSVDGNPGIRRLLLSHKIELVLPLLKDQEVIGFLCLGEHLTSIYTPRDLRVLDTVSNELTIAVQNALSIDEVRDLNTHLEQRIESATKELRASNAQLHKLDEAKDEFISMASHQLRTPLTSIKGYISMLIDGDVGEVSKEQKHLLSEAFISSERMVRLIGDFLNVSRLQTGKFIIDKRPIDLATVVRHEVEALGPNAGARGVKFMYKQPKNIPELLLDENKIQQVIMNFCDNAMYYSKDNSRIKVALSLVGNEVEFTVTDTGIGVPADQQDQLFNKFFRATNARQQRPDGTGVGLFLAKKVLDAHSGKIIFKSKEGKGSTFGFRLPVPKR